MSKPIKQIISDLINDFVVKGKSVEEIVADVKQNFSLRDEILDVADALLASPHPELRAAGQLLTKLESIWTSETPTDYLRGTNILVNKPCTCADPNVIDRTCPLYGTSEHGKIIAKRWVDNLLK